jgi:hypothetical protein
MKSINRYVAVVKPKQSFIDWANQLPDAEERVTLAELQTDCMAILIPESEIEGGSEAIINSMALALLEEELESWCTHEPWWPQNRTNDMFWELFDVEVHSVVMDAGRGPIRKEDV